MSKKYATDNDLDHGFFGKVSSLYSGDAYDKKLKKPSVETGKQMMTNKGGKNFEEHPPRIFAGEAYFDERKFRMKQERKEKAKQLTYKFTPSGHGVDTFSGPLEHFSPQVKPEKKKPKEPKNFLTSPGKRGTGFGFPDVTLGKQTSFLPVNYGVEEKARRKEAKEHKKKQLGGAFKASTATSGIFDANPYHPEPIKEKKTKPKPVKKIEVPFRPTGTTRKAVAGKTSHLDTFDKFTYKADPYEKKPPKPKVKPIGPPFRPNAPTKSTYVRSVVDLNVRRSMMSSK